MVKCGLSVSSVFYLGAPVKPSLWKLRVYIYIYAYKHSSGSKYNVLVTSSYLCAFTDLCSYSFMLLRMYLAVLTFIRMFSHMTELMFYIYITTHTHPSVFI